MELSLINGTSKISFCDKECINIINNHFKKALFQKFETKFNLNPTGNLNNVKLDTNKIKNIANNPHIIATITHGNPYLLYFTVIDRENVIILIDRKKKENHVFPKMHVLYYKFSDEIFNDTIITCELIRDINKQWFMLIDNILFYSGKSLKNSNIISKFEILYSIFNNNFTPSDEDICPFQIKRIFSYKQLNYLFSSYIPNLSYACKGLMFYTLNPKYTNYIYDIPKNQQIQHASPSPVLSIPTEIPNSDIYCNFKILKTDLPDIYQLYKFHDDEPLLQGIALIPNIKISKMMHNIFSNSIHAIMKCKLSPIFNKWIPIELINN